MTVGGRWAVLRNSGLSYKFGDVLATTLEEERRLKTLRGAVAKLPFVKQDRE